MPKHIHKPSRLQQLGSVSKRYMCKRSVSDHAPSAKDLVQNTGIHLSEGILKVYAYLQSHPLCGCGKAEKQLHHLLYVMVL